MIPVSEKVLAYLEEHGYMGLPPRSYLEIWNILCSLGKAIDVYSFIGTYNVRCRFLVYEADKEVYMYVQTKNCKTPEEALLHAIELIVNKDLFRYDKGRVHGIESTTEP